MNYINPNGADSHGDPGKGGPFCFRELLYRLLALLFLIAAIGAVLLIAEDASAVETATEVVAWVGKS